MEQVTDIDDTPLTFGKYEDKTPNEIAHIDPSYVVWLYDNLEKKFCSAELRDMCEEAKYESYEDGKEEDMYYGLDGW